MLPIVLYVCEFRSVTLREEHILMVFENRVLRRIFGRERDEVMGGITQIIFRLIELCTVLMQETSTILVDQLLTCYVFRRVRIVLASKL
jgi:hypothetical protein